MEKPSRDAYTSAFAVSFITTSVLSALLVVTKESYQGLKIWMKAFSGHHWITHSILVIVLFLLLGFLLMPLLSRRQINLNVVSVMMVMGTLISGFIIAGFYLLH
jgi:membrane-bound metal-dependent hydrolase YbcI (DUF457 family)